MVISLAGCGSDGTEQLDKQESKSTDTQKTQDKPGKQDKKLLGIVMPNATHGFLGESVQHCENRVKELSKEQGFDYKFLTAGESSEQANHVDTLLAMNVGTIMLWPMNGKELRSSAQKIKDAGIPLVIYDRLIEGFQPECEVYGDNTNVGALAGKYFNEFFKEQLNAGETINILEFKGDASTVPKQRSDGFFSEASEQFNVLQSFSTDWQRLKSMQQMETFLTTKSKEEIESVQAIYTHDDEVTMGILDALRNYSGNADINIKLLGGNGGRDENIKQFKDPGVGDMKMVTTLFSPHMIRDCVDIVAKCMLEGEVEDLYIVPTHLIDYDGVLAKKCDPNGQNIEEYKESDDYTIRYSIEGAS